MSMQIIKNRAKLPFKKGGTNFLLALYLKNADVVTVTTRKIYFLQENFGF